MCALGAESQAHSVRCLTREGAVCVHPATRCQLDLRIILLPPPSQRWGALSCLTAVLGGYRCYPSFADEENGPTEGRPLTLKVAELRLEPRRSGSQPTLVTATQPSSPRGQLLMSWDFTVLFLRFISYFAIMITFHQ